MKLISHLPDNQYPFEGLTHVREVARGVILNDKDEVAILKLHSDDNFGTRDCYELPGGGVKEGESFIEAFQREAIEETGFKVRIIEEIGDVIDYYNLIHRENHNHYFLGRTTEFLGLKLEEYETHMIQELLFVPIDKAIELFSTQMFGGVGKLVQQRELPILKLAKSIIEKQ